MGDQESIKVDSELYVNEATLELLRRRIDSEVKLSFFRSIGLPVGGAGLLAIAFALFFWIPDNVQKFIDSDRVQETLEQSAQEYLISEAGQEFVRAEIEQTAQKQVEGDVGAYFKGEEGRELVRKHVEGFVGNDPAVRRMFQQSAQAYLSDPQTGQHLVRQLVEAYFTTEIGRDLVGDLIAQNLTSPDVKDVIINAVNEVFEPAVAQLSERIRENMGRLVAEVVQTVEYARDVQAQEPQMIPKESIEKLYQFLDSPEASEFRLSGVPIALTKSIRRGYRYEAGAIHQYISMLLDYFADQFAMVLILDNDGSFLALLTPEEMQSTLDYELMDLLNADPDEVPTADAKAALAERFGNKCIQYIPTAWSVSEALTRPVWSRPDDVTEEVAVVQGDGKFRGTTSRGRLIEGILG